MQLKQPKVSLPGVTQQKDQEPPMGGPAPVVPPAPGGNLFQPMRSPSFSSLATPQKDPSYAQGGGNDLLAMIQKIIRGGFNG